MRITRLGEINFPGRRALSDYVGTGNPLRLKHRKQPLRSWEGRLTTRSHDTLCSGGATAKRLTLGQR